MSAHSRQEQCDRINYILIYLVYLHKNHVQHISLNYEVMKKTFYIFSFPFLISFWMSHD